MKREMIEKIINIVKEFNEEHEWTDEYSFLSDLKEKCKKVKIKYEYLDKYNVDIKISNISSEDFITLDSRYADINIYRVKGTKKSGSYILNSEKQPNNELLMRYGHPTGPYIFGGHSWEGDSYYDSELFEKYFDELKSYGYSYIDEVNHHIYYTIENGMKLYKNYESICKKYQNIFNEGFKKHKLNKLKEQMEELEKSDK